MRVLNRVGLREKAREGVRVGATARWSVRCRVRASG